MIVLDCSAAVNIVQKTEEGLALRSFLLSGEEIVSSTLLHPELLSSFRKYVKAGIYTRQEAQEMIEDALSLVHRFFDLADYYKEAFAESLHFDHSPYDMFYFILARQNAATLISLDRSLLSLCEQARVNCVHIETSSDSEQDHA
jgi:predicted nucleic acid-binding protein